MMFSSSPQHHQSSYGQPRQPVCGNLPQPSYASPQSYAYGQPAYYAQQQQQLAGNFAKQPSNASYAAPQSYAYGQPAYQTQPLQSPSLPRYDVAPLNYATGVYVPTPTYAPPQSYAYGQSLHNAKTEQQQQVWIEADENSSTCGGMFSTCRNGVAVSATTTNERTDTVDAASDMV